MSADIHDLRRLIWVGPLAIIAAVLAVVVFRAIAGAVVTLPTTTLPAVTYPALVIFTIVLVSMAVVVFAVIALRSSTPAHTFRRVALWALVVSFIPDLLLPLDPALGATPAVVIVLMLEHVAAWWTTVRILTRWGLSGSGQ